MHALEPRDRRPLTRFVMVVLFAAAVSAVVGVRQFVVSKRAARETSAVERSSVRASSCGLPAAQSLEALLQNDRPKRLLRMIPYDPASQPQLSIARLKTLGRPDQQFTFVGDFDELRGCTAAEAVYKCGGNLDPGQNISAIIFPAGDRLLYAASARGVLEVITAVEKTLDAAALGPDFVPTDLQKRLPSPALAALDDTSNDAGRWINYRRYYRDYARTVAEIRAAHCTVLDRIGSIDADWHPLGYAQALGRQQPGAPGLFVELEGERMPVPDFGARVFLVANAPLAELTGQCLIDFDDPARQRIPDLDAAVQ